MIFTKLGIKIIWICKFAAIILKNYAIFRIQICLHFSQFYVKTTEWAHFWPRVKILANSYAISNMTSILVMQSALRFESEFWQDESLKDNMNTTKMYSKPNRCDTSISYIYVVLYLYSYIYSSIYQYNILY